MPTRTTARSGLRSSRSLKKVNFIFLFHFPNYLQLADCLLSTQHSPTYVNRRGRRRFSYWLKTSLIISTTSCKWINNGTHNALFYIQLFYALEPLTSGIRNESDQ